MGVLGVSKERKAESSPESDTCVVMEIRMILGRAVSADETFSLASTARARIRCTHRLTLVASCSIR
jgi:hypothetical protein